MSEPPAAQVQQEPMRARGVDLTQGSLLGGILLLSWPIIASAFLNWLMGVADIKMVGFLGPDAIAAVGTSRGAIMTLMAIILAISTGTQVLVARYTGERRPDRVANVTRQAILCSVIFGVLMVPLGLWLSGSLLASLGAKQSVLVAGTVYMRAYFWGSVALMLNFMVSAALNGAGDTLTPLLLLLGVNIAHIILEWAMIFGVGPFPAMGVAGAAWAVVVSRGVAALLMLWIVFSGRFAVSVPWRGAWLLDLSTWGKMFYIGIPSSIQGLARNLSYLLLIWILNRTAGGMLAVSGHTICGQVQMVGVMIGLALMGAAMIAVGQNLGAESPERAERSCWTIVRLSVAISVVMGGLSIIFGRSLVGFFTDDPQAIHWGFLSLVILSSVLPFSTAGMAFSGALRGAGDTLSPLWATLICLIGIAPALGYGLAISLGMGPVGAWLGLAVAMIAQTFIIGWIFKQGKWKTIKL